MKQLENYDVQALDAIEIKNINCEFNPAGWMIIGYIIGQVVNYCMERR